MTLDGARRFRERGRREREAGWILHALLFGACVAEIHLLHFAFQNLRQEDRRVIAFANVTQHLA